MLFTKEAKSLFENGRQREARGVRMYSLSDVDRLLSPLTISIHSKADSERSARALAPRETAAAAGEIHRINGIGELKLLSAPTDRFQRVFSGRDSSSGDPLRRYHLYDLSKRRTLSNPGRITCKGANFGGGSAASEVALSSKFG